MEGASESEHVASEGHWRPFRRLAEVQMLHAAGDGMVAVALANTLFFAVPLGEARDKVALYLALTMAPFAGCHHCSNPGSIAGLAATG